MNERWNVDLHSHTFWSKDCLMPFEKIIRLCERRGIDRIAITDHNTADGALAMQKLAPDLVIVGEEINPGLFRPGKRTGRTVPGRNDPPAA
jgi:predicted metal-dependent phosphoesterase TrpH